MICGTRIETEISKHYCILEDDGHAVHACKCGYNWTGGKKDLPHVTHLSLSDDELYFLSSFIIFAYVSISNKGIESRNVAHMHMIDACNQVGAKVVEGFISRFKKLAEANPNFTTEEL